MLYQLGPITIDVAPFNVTEVERNTEASLAEKSLIGDLPQLEYTGYKSDLSLSGKILPFHLGGLDSLELLHTLCIRGEPVMLVRGDGMIMGWHALSKITEKHESLAYNGVGFSVTHQISLTKIPPPNNAATQGLVTRLLSLF